MLAASGSLYGHVPGSMLGGFGMVAVFPDLAWEADIRTYCGRILKTAVACLWMISIAPSHGLIS